MTIVECCNCGRECDDSLCDCEGICDRCKRDKRRCTGCRRYLSECCYTARDASLCESCVNRRDNRQPTVNTALHRTITEVSVPATPDDTSYIEFIESRRQQLHQILNEEIRRHSSLRLQVRTTASFTRETDGILERVSGHFNTPAIHISSAIDGDLDGILSVLNFKVDRFLCKGSGFVFSRVKDFTLVLTKYDPFHSGSSWIETPTFLQNKKCLVNVKNDDNLCFLWSILACIYEVPTNKHRVSKYRRHLHTLRVDGLRFPLPAKDIRRFEDLNTDISINLYGVNDDNTFSVEYVTPYRNRSSHVNLLMLEEGEKKHYVWVKSMSRMVAGRTKHTNKATVCSYCLHAFSSQQSHDDHLPYCMIRPAQMVTYPDENDPEDSTLKFRAAHKQYRIPFFEVADFEAYLQEIHRDDSEDDEDCGTRNVEDHVLSGFCCYRVSDYEEYQAAPVVYSGPDVIENFYKHIRMEADFLADVIRKIIPMSELSHDDESQFDKARHCLNCGTLFTTNNMKVKHHDHISGRYLFPCCNRCNLQLKPPTKREKKDDATHYKQSYKLAVLFHNCVGYDSHFIIKNMHREFARRDKKGRENYDDVQIIPLSGEKYVQFSVGSLTFLDTCRFLPEKLSKLVSMLRKSGKENFKHTRKHLQKDDDVIFAKCCYCYNYMNGPSRFLETELPPIEAFYDRLNDKPVKPEAYARTVETWRLFNMKTLQDFHDHYLKTDVLLLSDVFCHFRDKIYEQHGIDCLHYVTLPSLSFDLALKTTGAEIELLSDPTAYLMLESSMRGGIATISKRYSSANNKYMKNFDEMKESNFICYLDANSLYGAAQCELLPVDGFRFLSDEEVNDFELEAVKSDGEYGYILECDIEYPEHLHASHSDYPLAPDHLQITKEILSPFTQNLLELSKRPHIQCKKLVPNLYNKMKYVVHYRNLQFYVKHGLKVTKIHRILTFRQGAWLAPWIALCNQERRDAKNDFESNLAKLQANSIFGKTIENLRKRVNLRLISDPNKLIRATSSVTFRRSQIINEDLVLVRAARKCVKLNRPIATGFCILELSKLIMFEFYYEVLKAKYGDRCTLLLTDTDSLVCEIKTEDLFEDMREMKDKLDTSNFDEGNVAYSLTNRRALGKFKSETADKMATEFVALRPKMYSLKVPEDEKMTMKKAKGVKREYVRKKVRHEEYFSVLHGAQKCTKAKFRMFRSRNHVVHTVEINKLCLTACDDKRFILPDGISTLAYGHCEIGR